MAHRKMFVTDAGASFYRTRMLSAGDPITLSGPEARLQAALGNVVAKKPRAGKLATANAMRAEAGFAPIPPVEPIPTVEDVLAAEVVETPKRASRKRGRRKAAS